MRTPFTPFKYIQINISPSWTHYLYSNMDRSMMAKEKKNPNLEQKNNNKIQGIALDIFMKKCMGPFV